MIMNEKLTAVINWLKENKLIAAGLGIAAVLVLMKKFGRKSYRRRRRLPRSVNYPVRRKRPGSTARRRSAGAKKPWQIKGSQAAKRRMALLRRKRNSKLF